MKNAWESKMDDKPILLNGPFYGATDILAFW